MSINSLLYFLPEKGRLDLGDAQSFIGIISNDLLFEIKEVTRGKVVRIWSHHLHESSYSVR